VKRQRVEIDGRQLQVSNLEKVLFPEVPFTKAQVIDYYVRIAPVLLPHLAGRPVTFTRWPDGVEGQKFFEKNSARHAPAWVRRVTIPSPGSSTGRETLDMVILESVADLAWAANLAALELHVPQWQVDDDGIPSCPTCWCSISTPDLRRGCPSAAPWPNGWGNGWRPMGWTRS